MSEMCALLSELTAPPLAHLLGLLLPRLLIDRPIAVRIAALTVFLLLLCLVLWRRRRS